MPAIYTVQTVNLSLEKSQPPNLVIDATGCARTGGWSNFGLSMVQFVVPPEDGVAVFTFEGTCPTGIVTQVIDCKTPKAQAVIEGIDIANYWGDGIALKGVRVLSETNAVEAAFP